MSKYRFTLMVFLMRPQNETSVKHTVCNYRNKEMNMKFANSSPDEQGDARNDAVCAC